MIIMNNSTRQTDSLHLIFYLFSGWTPKARFCASSAADAAGLSVLLGQSTGHGSQELVHCHVDLRGEIRWEIVGHDHKDAVDEELSKKNVNKV